MSRPDPGVELLERALGYTRGTLLHVRPAHLSRPTPCAGWTLDQLLDHMHDALDAFVEGAGGVIALAPPARALDVRVSTLQAKACALLGAWTTPVAHAGPAAQTVVVGGLAAPRAVVLRAAALEVTTHGWDVGQATGQRAPIPAALARDLAPVARRLVVAADRGDRFGPPLPEAPGAGPADRLLAYLGRRPDLTGPPVHDLPDRRTRESPAS